MNIAICDDDAAFRDFLSEQITEYFSETAQSLNIFMFSNGEKLSESSLLFDIAFLDVEMENMNGIDAGISLKKKNPYCVIIIVTSYGAYLDDAFKINAFRFLSKPLDKSRLYSAVDDALEIIKNDVIVFRDTKKNEDVKVCSRDIILIETHSRGTRVVTVNGTYYSKDKIGVWRSRLGGISFVCPHKSYIVNLDYSVKHTRSELLLARKDENGRIAEEYTVGIAPKKQAEIKKLFFNLMRRR